MVYSGMRQTAATAAPWQSPEFVDFAHLDAYIRASSFLEPVVCKFGPFTANRVTGQNLKTVFSDPPERNICSFSAGFDPNIWSYRRETHIPA